MPKNMDGAGSLGGAMARGLPVVFTSKESGRKPQLLVKDGDEKKAIKLLADMGVIELMKYPDKA